MSRLPPRLYNSAELCSTYGHTKLYSHIAMPVILQNFFVSLHKTCENRLNDALHGNKISMAANDTRSH